MLEKNLSRYSNCSTLPLRIVIGIIFIGHGGQQLFGWFGGGGLTATAEAFQKMGLNPSYLMALLASSGEFFGGLFLLLGLFTRFSAFVIAIIMLVAIFKVHLHGGLFAKNGGFEYPLTILAGALTIMLSGNGKKK